MTIRSTLLIVFSAVLFAACVPEMTDATMSKSDARAQAGKADNSIDFCEAFGWYGDGVCDDFCTNPDPDCDGNQYCYADDDCASDERCNAAELCLSDCPEGLICPAVCAGFCVEAPAEKICGGFANLPCDDDQWCSFGNPPSEAAADMSGVCLPRPEVCIELFAPVCGTDGQTYSNSCFANAAGVDVDHEGECAAPEPAMCGGFANIPCASSSEWCSFGNAPAGSAADMSGVCLPRPEACIQLFDPVCGRDGQTYSNSCFANMAGVDAISSGSCQ